MQQSGTGELTHRREGPPDQDVGLNHRGTGLMRQARCRGLAGEIRAMILFLPVCILCVAHFCALLAIFTLSRAGENRTERVGKLFIPRRIRQRLLLSTFFQAVALLFLVYFTLFTTKRVAFEISPWLVMGSIPAFYCAGLLLHSGALVGLYRFGQGSMDLPNGQSLRPSSVATLTAVSLFAHGCMVLLGPYVCLRLML